MYPADSRSCRSTMLVAGVVAALMLVLPTGGMAFDPAQRDTEVRGWMSDPELSAELRARAASLQSERERVNARAHQLSQHAQTLRARWEREMAPCRGRISASQKAACDRDYARLKADGDALQSQGHAQANEARRVIADYQSLKRDIGAYRAAQRGADQASWHDAWTRGHSDALRCSASNGHGYCSGAGGDYNSCRDGYAAGFGEGGLTRDAELDAAERMGRDDGAAGIENRGFTHPSAKGPCRVPWLERYDQGHFRGRTDGG